MMHSEITCKYGCPRPPEQFIVWQDEERRLFIEGRRTLLYYKNRFYTFRVDGHEPMAIIMLNNEPAAYIHNSFDVEYECQQFRRDPNYRCRTITGKEHDAKYFCWLLTTAIDYAFDCQIDDVERIADELIRYESREVWYHKDGIEFGRYGEEEGGREEYHYEYEILYIIVDGKKYHLNDNVNEPDALYLFEPGRYGRKHAALRIHGTRGAVLAAYADDWKAGHTFTPFGHPCDTKTFCAMIAYALRSGKKDFTLRELENNYTL